MKGKKRRMESKKEIKQEIKRLKEELKDIHAPAEIININKARERELGIFDSDGDIANNYKIEDKKINK